MYNWLYFIYSLELLYYMVRLCRWMQRNYRTIEKNRNIGSKKNIYLYLLKWSQWWENVYTLILCVNTIAILNNSQFGSKPVKQKVNKSDARTTYIGKRFHVSNYFSLIMWNTNVNPGDSFLFSVKQQEWNGMEWNHHIDVITEKKI